MHASRAEPLLFDRGRSHGRAAHLVMIKHFDHLTIVVSDLQAARHFFTLLGFAEVAAVTIKGRQFEDYMGVKGIEAEHVTLALKDAVPRTEVQLLKYRHPDAKPQSESSDLTRLGFNHICFAVENLDAEVARLKANGVQFRNDVMSFHERKLVFLAGPEGITVELAQWDRPRA